jgi:hypothetical protein
MVTKAKGGSVHPAAQIPGVHISERIHGKPIFTEERVGKAGGGSMSVFPKPQRMLEGDDFVQGGKYIDTSTKEDVTGHKASEASIVIAPGGKPSFTASRDAVDQTGSPGRGSAAIKANLFKQKAGWRWSQAPEGHEDTSTIVSVEHRGKHHYALAAHFPKGVELARYADASSEPRLRPTTQGNIELGPQVGSINVRGREHPVHEHVIAKSEGGLLTGKDEDGEDGIIAYQGGPHSVGPEGYDNAKIGTGEGAQLYGYGHYFAEHEPVAQEYRKKLSSSEQPDIEHMGAKFSPGDLLKYADPKALHEEINDATDALENAKKKAELEGPNSPWHQSIGWMGTELAALRHMAEHGVPALPKAGHMHQVRIQGRPEHFLDWDAPIDEQSPHVTQALEKADWWPYAREGADELADRHGQNAAGSDIMRWLHDDWTKPEASQMLSDLGIRGVRFLDQGSRPKGKGTRNYVVFDPKHIEIQRRYARGGMAYGDGGSVPPSLHSKMLAAYNETLPSIERQYKDWARKADDAALHKVTADDIESNYGEDDEIHPRDAEAIKIARQKGHVIAESRNGETTYHDPDKAPTLEQHMQSVVEDQGGKRPAQSLSDLDYSHTSGIHDALMELAQHHGWKKQSTQGNKYFDLVHPQKGRIGVRIADHPNTSRQGPVNRDAAEVNLNLAPKGRPDAPAHDLDDAAQMLSAQNSGPRRAYGDGGTVPDPSVQKALDLTRDLNPQGLYSHAAEAAMASPQAKGPLPQMLASLKGVKPDEMKYSGVEQAFADQPQVTREQLAQHFTKNLPQLKETTLQQSFLKADPRPKYQAYTLPGGENYREVLLHRPVRPQKDVVNDVMNFHREMNGIYGPRWGQEGNPLSPEHQDEYDRLEDALISQRDEYSHPHWSVPNVVGHYRASDRTGPNGEKIMHVEEVQSDWAQQARATKKKRGVAGYDPAKPYQVYDPSTGKVVSQHATPEEALAEEESRNIDEASAGDDRKYFSTNHAKMLNIPPAGPFVSSTDNATDLILKRILTEAARGNYDKVVFTPGDEQVRRWGEPGLKPYYDETLPKRLNDLVKQHDPEEKMGGHEISGLETLAEDKDDAHHRMEERAGGELSLEQAAAVRDYLDHDRMARGHLRLGAFEEAVDHAMRTVPDAKRTFPGINVTPRLREGINKRGFKAYARGGDVEGTMRIAKAGGGPLGDDEAVKKALALTAQAQAPAPQQAVQAAKQQAPSAFFEIAPGETYHPTLQKHWEMLRPQAKAAISNKMIGEYLSRWQRISGIQGEVRPGHGGFAGYTNPNYTFHPYDPNDMQRSLHELGHLFSQDAMMGAHEHPFPGSSLSGVVRINMPPGVSSQEVHRVYKALHEKGLAEGHSTNPETGTMDILAGSGGEDTIAHAKAIDAHLNGKYDVSSFPTNVSFPTHGADYGVSGTLSGGASEPSTSEAYNNLKAEASRRLEELVKQAHIQRGGRRGEISFGDTLAPGQPHPDTVSASMPTHAAVYKGPPLPGETRADISPSQHSNPNLMATASRMWAQHPASGGEQLDGPQAMKKLTDFHVKNLLELWDRTPIEQRKTSRHWYRSAHQVGNAIAEEHGLPPRAAHGMMAVLSPQTPWDRNVSLAERVADAMTHHQDTPWTAGMSHVAYQGGGGGKGLPFDKGTKETGPHRWADIEGKTLRQVLEGPHGEARAAMWVRAFDEAHNPSEYRSISPTGEFMGTMLNKTGSAPDTLSWNSYSPIKKAISIYRNPNLENINEQIGTQHKVREFYNTIANPDDPNAVVADTHAVAAGQMLPHGSSAKAVHQNFGSIPSTDQKRRLADAGDPWIEGVDSPKKTGSTGASGDYPIHAEAVRQAAWARGVHPSEMQSVTWETVRTLFRNKSRPVQKAAREIWGRYAKGQLNHKQAIDALFNMAGGLARPNWASQAGRGTGNITTGSYKKPSGITPETPALERYGSSNTEEEPMSTGGAPQKQRSVVHDALRLTSRYGQMLPDAVNLARQHTRGRP